MIPDKQVKIKVTVGYLHDKLGSGAVPKAHYIQPLTVGMQQVLRREYTYD